MHILPSSKIPFLKVPMDLMISSKITFLKKKDKRIKNEGRLEQESEPIHPNEKEAADEGLLLIDEFKFPHAVY